MSSKLGEKERATLKEAFDYFDKNKDGKISADELKQVMKSLGQKPSDKTVKKMMKSVSNEDQVGFDNFVKLMETRVEDAEKEMRQAFKAFDKDGNGFISPEELKEAMGNMGIPLNEEDVALMMSEADVNGDGQISYQEFITTMASKSR